MPKYLSMMTSIFILFCLIIIGVCVWHFTKLELHHWMTLVFSGILIILIIKHGVNRWIGFFILILSYAIFPMFSVVGKLIPYRFDDILYALDGFIFGQSLPLYLTYRSVWLAEYLAMCYLALFPMQLGACYYWFKNNQEDYQAFCFGLLMLMLMGYIGYFIFPAQGGYLAYGEVFNLPNTGGYMTQFLMNANQRLIVGIDAFPSLHTGFSVFINGFFFIKKRWVIGCSLLPVTLGLMISTQYFAFHYGVDLLAGLILAMGVLIFIAYHHKVQS